MALRAYDVAMLVAVFLSTGISGFLWCCGTPGEITNANAILEPGFLPSARPVAQGQPFTSTFLLRNMSRNSITLMEVAGSCGCMELLWDSEDGKNRSIAPSRFLPIQVTVHTTGLVGEHSYFLRCKCVDQDGKAIDLESEIRLDVARGISFFPDSVWIDRPPDTLSHVNVLVGSRAKNSASLSLSVQQSSKRVENIILRPTRGTTSPRDLKISDSLSEFIRKEKADIQYVIEFDVRVPNSAGVYEDWLEVIYNENEKHRIPIVIHSNSDRDDH